MKKNHGIDWADSELQQQILDQIPTMVMAVDTDLNITYLNSAVLTMLGKSKADCAGQQCCEIIHGSHCNTAQCVMRNAMNQKEALTDCVEITINQRLVPVECYAVPLLDRDGKIIGGLEYGIDITERVRYQQKMQEQSYTIKEISTPALTLWDGVVVLPVVGVIDSLRAQHMMDTMLEKIMETSSRVIILDIQGVAAVDTAVANHLIKITKATKLMGCQCILSGISPAVAQAIVQLGIDMGDIKTNATLKDALQEAFMILQLEVKKIRRLESTVL